MQVDSRPRVISPLLGGYRRISPKGGIPANLTVYSGILPSLPAWPILPSRPSLTFGKGGYLEKIGVLGKLGSLATCQEHNGQTNL